MRSSAWTWTRYMPSSARLEVHGLHADADPVRLVRAPTSRPCGWRRSRTASAAGRPPSSPGVALLEHLQLEVATGYRTEWRANRGSSTGPSSHSHPDGYAVAHGHRGHPRDRRGRRPARPVRRRGRVPVDAFGGDPLTAARAFAEAGARWAHVVDMDLASTGRPAERGRRARGGGPRTPGAGERRCVVARAGREPCAPAATRVVLGSAALGTTATRPRRSSRPRGTPWCGGRGRRPGDPSAWRRARAPAVGDPPVACRTSGAPVAVRRGRPRRAAPGSDLDGIWALATHTTRPVIASGGIRDLEDLRAIAALGPAVEGAVAGRSLYEGDSGPRPGDRGPRLGVLGRRRAESGATRKHR